jgi:beta-glucanase (GH16 family)
MEKAPSSRRGSGFHVHPVVLAVFALAIGAAVGFGGHLGGRPKGASSAQTATSQQPDPSNTKVNTYAPQVPPPGSHLTFDATFTGSSLNTQVWNTCYWYVPRGSGCGHPGAYPENQWYLPSQDQVSGGALNLVASPIATSGKDANGNPEVFPCRSGIVTTDPSYDFTYGYLQVVARLPKGRNAWPALWMLPANHSTNLPEIDIMEIIGTTTTRPAMAFHPSLASALQQATATTTDLSSGWHTFGLNWQPGSLTWFIDGKAVFATTNHVPSQPMYFLANLAITDVFQPLQLPTSCSATMSIQSVKVWQNTPG